MQRSCRTSHFTTWRSPPSRTPALTSPPVCSFDQLSPDNVEAIRQGILDYARREYVTGEAEQNSACAFSILSCSAM